MAVYSLVQQWIELRQFLQKQWKEVAYHGLNSAVAATLSHTAIAMVKQSQLTIFVDFPGHDSYETVMQTMTRGNIEKSRTNFSISFYKVGPNEISGSEVEQRFLDVEEQFMIHSYKALQDFIDDFQATRSGKPTKRLMIELSNWQPNLDLQRVTKLQRIKWRRAYIINWLYDLVNVFAAIVVQRINLKGQKIRLESVDWSTKGPWNEHRRLYGLNEFAGEITRLAMQKPGTDITSQISPHLVFQLQCIVDAFTVSRGWSLSSFRGHSLCRPARSFRPRKDVDLFMDRENKALGRGYCNSVDVFEAVIKKHSDAQGRVDNQSQTAMFLKEFRQDLIDWLGEPKYMYGLTTIPPSRFTTTNANGPWEYSPFLNGAGLLEALELTQYVGLWIMDQTPEAISAIHLHNMLVRKRYITNEIGLYTNLQILFGEALFAKADAPESDFFSNFGTVIQRTSTRKSRKLTNHIDLSDLNDMFDPGKNQFFKHRSIANLYRKADWSPAKIPEEDIPMRSMLFYIRIGQIVSPSDSDETIEKKESILLSRARANGLSTKSMVEMAARLKSLGERDEMPEELMNSIPEYRDAPKNKPVPKNNQAGGFSKVSDMLAVLKTDTENQITGQQPYLSLNYNWAIMICILLFDSIENRLESIRHPILTDIDKGGRSGREIRITLTALLLDTKDEVCLKAVAQVFEDTRAGFAIHTCWEDIGRSPFDKDKDDDTLDDDELDVDSACTVM